MSIVDSAWTLPRELAALFRASVRSIGVQTTGRIHPRYLLLGTRAADRKLDLTHGAVPTVDPMTMTPVDLRSQLNAGLDQLRELVGFDWAVVFVLGGHGVTVLGQRGMSPEYQSLLRLLRLRPEYAERLISLLNGAPGRTADTQSGSIKAEVFREAAGDRLLAALGRTRSVMWFPVRRDRLTVGSLLLGHEAPDHYTAWHQQTALVLAERIAALAWSAYVVQQAQDRAAVEEQRRLARDLHDSVAQTLYSLWLSAQSASALLESDRAAARDLLGQVVSLAEDGLAEVRAMVLGLRPESLETEGLVAALERQVEVLRARGLLYVDAILGPEPDIELAAKEELFFVAREALQNAVKHSGAQRITLTLRLVREFGQETELEVSDDGIGFDASVPRPGHLGLTSMLERVQALGGTLQIDSAQDLGTHVRVRLPATPASPELGW